MGCSRPSAELGEDALADSSVFWYSRACACTLTPASSVSPVMDGADGPEVRMK